MCWQEGIILCDHYWFILDYILLFQVWLCLTQCFCFGIQRIFLYLSHLINYQRYSKLAISLFQTETVTIHQVMFRIGKTILVPADMNIFNEYFMSFRAACWMFIIICIINSNLSFPALHQLWRLSKLQQSPDSLWFPLPDVVISVKAMLSY